MTTKTKDNIDIEVQDLQIQPIGFNYNFVKERLEKELETYNDIVVTEDSLKTCKEKQRELARLRTNIDKSRKEIKKEYLKPVEDFETKCKELIELISQVEIPLKQGISEYDQKRKDENVKYAREMIITYIKKLGIFDDFANRFVIKPFVSNLTAKKTDIKNDIERQAEDIKKDQIRYYERINTVKKHIDTINETFKLTVKIRYEEYEHLIDSDVDLITMITNRADQIKNQEEQIKKEAEEREKRKAEIEKQKAIEEERQKAIEEERQRTEMIEKSRVTVPDPEPDMYDNETTDNEPSIFDISENRGDITAEIETENQELIRVDDIENENTGILGEAEDGSNEWHNLRSKGIGGSDVSKIVGVSTYGTALSVWMKKTGKLNENTNGNNFSRWGHILETPIAQEFEKQSGLKTVNTDKTYYNKENPFMLANLDRLIINDDGEVETFLEIKTAIQYKLSDWDEEIPDEYMLQIQHYMYVMGFNYCYLAVLIGGNDFRYFKIDRDSEIIDSLLTIEKNFWNMVVKNEMPEPTFADDSKDIKKLYETMYGKTDDDTEIELDNTFDELADKYKELDSQIKELTKEKDECKNKMIAMLQEFSLGKSDNYKVSYKYSNSFNADLVEKNYPELYEKYKTAFDKTAFKRDNKKIYTECTEPGSPRFTLKEVK